jgi:hypothetical protein
MRSGSPTTTANHVTTTTSPLLDPVTAAILSTDYNPNLSNTSDYLSQLLHSIVDVERDPSEALVGTYSHASVKSFDQMTRSRLLMSSSFTQRFSFVNPNNSAQLSTFLLLNSMIGSGILNQPYVFRESGLLGGVSDLLSCSMILAVMLSLCLSVSLSLHTYAVSGLCFVNGGDLDWTALFDCRWCPGKRV